MVWVFEKLKINRGLNKNSNQFNRGNTLNIKILLLFTLLITYITNNFECLDRS